MCVKYICMQVYIHIYLSNEITSFRSDNILSKSHKLHDKIPSSKHKKTLQVVGQRNPSKHPQKYTTAVALGYLPNFKVSIAKDIKALWTHNLGGSELDLNTKSPP